MLSAMFALVSDLIVRIVRSTKPVPVCKLGVHLIRVTFSPLQNYLNSLLLKQLPLSVLIHRGIPLSAKYFVENFKTFRTFANLCGRPFTKTVDGYQNINIAPRLRFDWTSEVQLNFLIRFGQNF